MQSTGTDAFLKGGTLKTCKSQTTLGSKLCAGETTAAMALTGGGKSTR